MGALDIEAVGRILLFIGAHVTTVLRFLTIFNQNNRDCDLFLSTGILWILESLDYFYYARLFNN